jgi:fimbrial chaperone protein
MSAAGRHRTGISVQQTGGVMRDARNPERSRKHRRRRAPAWTGTLAFIALSLAGLSPAAHASGLSVAPTTIEFAPSESVQGLTLHNSGDTIISAQLRVFEWSQRDGQDVLTPNTDLVISPPILRIAPGQRQLVRVVRAHFAQAAATSPSQRERTYRVLIDELPVAAIDPGAVAPSGLNFVLRFSVPVFVAADAAPVASAPARLSLQAGASGQYQLRAENPTPRRLQLADLQVTGSSGDVVFTETGLLGYVLAGGERSWPLNLKADALATATKIQIRINGETVQESLSAMPLEWPAP